MREALACAARLAVARRHERLEKARVVAHRLEFERQRLAAETAVEIAPEADARATRDPRRVHRVAHAVVERRAPSVGEEAPVEVEPDPAVARGDRGDLPIEKMPGIVGKERRGVRMRRDHARAGRREEIVERLAREVRRVVEDPERIERLDEPAPLGRESAGPRVAARVAASVPPREPDDAHAARVPPRRLVGRADGIGALHQEDDAERSVARDRRREIAARPEDAERARRLHALVPLELHEPRAVRAFPIEGIAVGDALGGGVATHLGEDRREGDAHAALLERGERERMRRAVVDRGRHVAAVHREVGEVEVSVGPEAGRRVRLIGHRRKVRADAHGGGRLRSAPCRPTPRASRKELTTEPSTEPSTEPQRAP